MEVSPGAPVQQAYGDVIAEMVVTVQVTRYRRGSPTSDGVEGVQEHFDQ